MNIRIVLASAAASLTIVACTPSDTSADQSADANNTTIAAEAAAREMHNEMSSNEADSHDRMGQSEDMDKMHNMDSMGGMAGDNMSGMKDKPKDAPMPMQDDM